MKAFIFFLALVISYTVGAQSSWKPLGPNGGLVSQGSSARSEYPSITTDSAGVPYIAYLDISDSLRLMIKEFDGTNWVNVGNLGYHLRGGKPNIVVSPNDTLYVGYYNFNDSSKPTVIKFDGTDWVQVGNPISRGSGSFYELSMVVDSNEQLYIGYGAYSSGPSYPPGKANIFTFDGTDWVPVGNTDFVQYSGRMSLRIGLNNELYLGYNTYYLTGHTPTSSWVQKWDGSGWDTVGTGFRYITNIDIAPDGTVYTLHEGAATGSGWYAVEKLVNNAWVQLGSTQVYGYGWEVATDKQGTPYIAHAAAVQKYDGNNWFTIGNGAFAGSGGAHQVHIAFGKDNVPYVVRRLEPGQGIDRVDAYYYDSVVVNSVNNLSESILMQLYPNPVRQGQNIRLYLPFVQEGDCYLTVYNALGQQMYYERCMKETTPIVLPTETFPSGSYYIHLQTGQKKHAVSFIVY